MAEPLNRELLRRRPDLAARLEGGRAHDSPERVVQFGEGNFLRAFADWMLDILHERELFRGRVVVVQPIPEGRARALQQQDGLYTVWLRGLEAGRVVESRRLITVVSRALEAHADWAALEACLARPELRFVISNTTEAGIAWVEEPWRPGVCPESFPAKITALLWRRFQACGGDPSRGLVFLPCELIDRNGAHLRECVLRHAAAWGLGQPFRDWVERHHHFLNTLVDRIVPGYPRAEAPRLADELGYDDALLVAGELFHLWVIEGPAALAGELPLHEAGLNVVWTDRLEPYRTRKVRLLNGAHTASVLAAWLAGLNTVREMMEDPLFGSHVQRLVLEEIAPTVPLPEPERLAYAQAVLERFRNPFLRHELLSIALNSVSKWRVRVLPSLLDHARQQGALPPRLTFSLAALLAFYRGQRVAPDRLEGRRAGAAYPIRDEPAVLDLFERAWREHAAAPDWPALSRFLCGQASCWGMDLNAVPGLTAQVARHLEAIHTRGVRPALEALAAWQT